MPPERDDAARGVDGGGGGLHHADAVGGDALVGEALRGDVAFADDHLVAERAGDEAGVGFQEHDVDAGVGAAEKASRGGAAEAAADDHDTRGGLRASEEGQ